MNNKINTIFDGMRHYKMILAFGVDEFLVLLSLFMAYYIRLGSIQEISLNYSPQIFIIALLLLPLKGFIFWFFNLYHISFRYMSIWEGISVAKASALASLVLALLLIVLRDINIFVVFPRSIIFLDCFLTFFFVTGMRAFFRLYYSNARNKKGKRILIMGAGLAGEHVVRDMARSPQNCSNPVGFVDDNPRKKNELIHGIRVYGGREDIPKLVKELKIDEILIAIPTANSKQIRDIMEYVREAHLKDVKVLPGLSDMINGNATVNDIRDISIEDLLGREPVNIDMEQISAFIKDNNILVTGAGGSIGSELCRQVIRFNPATLLIFDIGETELFYIDRELREDYPRQHLVPVIGDIKDEKKVLRVFQENRIDTVFHAAAYKHVPLMESNPREAVLNNVLGTRVLTDMASKYGVDKFIFISTDKAVNPTSVMGMTKRTSENMVRGLKNNTTSFIAVRFGNVIGSRGSVIPIFQEQIRKGGPITITDQAMQRYFMTIPEAAQLVMQAGTMGRGGDVFVLDMGEPVSIYQVAEDLIMLSGLEPDKDIPIVISGSRPGEKLFEELLTAEEGTTSTLHQKIYSARISEEIGNRYYKKVDNLISIAKNDQDKQQILNLLKDLVPTYRCPAV